MEFEVGKTYKVTEEYADDAITSGMIAFNNDDLTFIVSWVCPTDNSAWTQDVSFCGVPSPDPTGWCVAQQEDLDEGYVFLVE